MPALMVFRVAWLQQLVNFNAMYGGGGERRRRKKSKIEIEIESPCCQVTKENPQNLPNRNERNTIYSLSSSMFHKCHGQLNVEQLLYHADHADTVKLSTTPHRFAPQQKGEKNGENPEVRC